MFGQGMVLQRRGLATAVRSALLEQAAVFPTKTALRCTQQKVRWTFDELLTHSGAVGSGLLGVGLKPGATVASALGNNAENVTLQLGAAAAGMRLASAAVAEKALTKDAVVRLLQEQEASVLVVSPEQLPTVYEAVPELRAISPRTSAPLALERFPHLKYVYHTGASAMSGTYRFRDMLEYAPMKEVLDLVEGDKFDFLVAVDAATGAAGSKMSQREALEAGLSTATEKKITPDSRVMFKAQKDTAALLAVGALACVNRGAEFVVPSAAFDKAACDEAMRQDSCDVTLA